MFNNKEKILLDLARDIRSISNTVGNLSKQTDNLTRVVHTDSDSLSKSISLLTQRVETIGEDLSGTTNQVKAQAAQIASLEVRTSELTKEAAKRDKFMNNLITAALAFLVPLFILTAANLVINQGEQVIIKTGEGG